jgi:hypothetical protein
MQNAERKNVEALRCPVPDDPYPEQARGLNASSVHVAFPFLHSSVLRSAFVVLLLPLISAEFSRLDPASDLK